MNYIKCILPLRIDWEPYYSTDSEISAGMRVRVVFSRKEYVAVVSETACTPEIDSGKILPILGLEEGLERITEEEIRFWRFLAGYYLCTIGEVYKAAYPENRTRSEQTAAGIREQAEARMEKKAAALTARLARLRERLEKKAEALDRKHSDTVREKLAEDKRQIEEQIRHTEDSLRRFFIKNEASGLPEAYQHGCHLDDTSPVLSGGVTLVQGSDRLSTYLSLASEVTASGRDVLYLVPEIVFTERLFDSLEDVFPGRVLAFHSHETTVRRREAAALLRQPGDQGRIVLGTRSALFLPYRYLGLIIVDEEHDSSYKQESPAPFYHGRDAAILLGSIHSCSVVIGSATPSLESIYNAAIGKYRKLSMDESSGTDASMKADDIEVIDSSAERKKNGMKGELSRKMLDAMGSVNGKVLVLVPWNPSGELKAEISAVTSRSFDIISTYSAKKTRLEGYALIALLHAEFMLRKEDFRADERVLQMIGQLRTRSGGARIIIQTSQGQHPVFKDFIHHYDGIALLEERKEFGLPPYSRMIDITVRDTNEARLGKLSDKLANALPVKGMGPFPVDSFNKEDIPTVCIRILLPRDKNNPEQKKNLMNAIADFEKAFKYPGHISINVDPV